MNQKRIAVLGGGGTGHTIAADLTLAGFQVTLYEQAKMAEAFEAISKRGGIKIEGAARKGLARVHRITTNTREALDDADVIIVAVVAARHGEIADLCLPYLRDGQIILISPGNAGSLIFARKLKKEGVKSEVILAEVEGNLYPCRLTGPAEVLVGLPTMPKYLAAFPGKDTKSVIDKLSGIYEFLPGTNILETTLNAPNVIGHLPSSLLNAGAVERSGGKYYLYTEGITDAVVACIDALHREKLALFRVLGYIDRHPIEQLRKVAKDPEFPELALFRRLIGPTSMQHRYITEDASTGVSLMISLGEMLNMPTPIAKALITLASTINGVDYLKEGRTIEKLGLGDMTTVELNRFLHEGGQ